MRISWRSAIGVTISVALLYWTLKNVDPQELWRVLRRSNGGWWALAVITATSIFPLRAIRWRLILDPVAPGIPLGMLWRSIAVGMMVTNLVFPSRAGEFARAYALTRETPKVGFAMSFASLAVDRVFDAVVLLFLLIVGVYQLPAAQETVVAGRQLSNWVGWGTVAMVAMVGALYLVVVFPSRIIGMYEALARRVAPRFEARGRDALLAFAAGLSVLRAPRRFAAVLFWTFLHWVVNALAFWFGFKAIGIGVPLLGAFVVQGLLAVGVAAPSSPGFFGVFEAFALVALGIYGVPEDQAVAWGFGYHILTFIPITLIGLYYFARLDLRFGDLRKAQDAGGVDAGSSNAASGSPAR
jgi:glycosyltransferase 2 family protein